MKINEPIHGLDRFYIVVAMICMFSLVLFGMNLSITKKTTSETTKQRVTALETQVEEWKSKQ